MRIAEAKYKGFRLAKIHCCFHSSTIMVDKLFATLILLVCYISDRIMISLKHILSCMHAGHCAMPGTREPVIGTVSLVTKDRECCDPHTHML